MEDWGVPTIIVYKDITGYVIDTWEPNTSPINYYDVYLKISPSNAVVFRVQDVSMDNQADLRDYLLFKDRKRDVLPIDVNEIRKSEWRIYTYKRRSGSHCEISAKQMSFNLNDTVFLPLVEASSLPLSQFLYNVEGNVQWLDLEQLQWCPKFKQNRRKRYAQISDGSSTILLTIWHTTIDELNNGMAINNGMVRLSCLKPETFKGQYKLETTLITTVS